MKKEPVKIILLVVFSIILLFPIYILFMSAFKEPGELFVVSLWPRKISFDNLKLVLNPKFLNSIKNSLFVYALARLDFPGKKLIFTTIISTLMIPTTTILVPLFMVCKSLGIENSYAGLIIPALFNAYGIFLFRQFYLDFPKELEEAAEVEGCGKVRLFVQIVLPLSRPMIVPLTIAFFLGTWNNYLWPLIINKKEEYQTIQVYLANMVSGYSTPWNEVIATAAMSAIPVFLLFLLLQKQLKEGIKVTGIK